MRTHDILLIVIYARFAETAPPVAASVRVVTVDGWPKAPIFSAGIIAGQLVFASGMIGANLAKGPPTLCAGGIAGQTNCALRNVAAVMEAAGSSMANVAECSVLMTDLARDSAAMNEIYVKHFPAAPPARVAYQVGALALGALVEIKCSGMLL